MTITAETAERSFPTAAHLTGDTEVSTVINPAGTATTPEEVGQLNTANTALIFADLSRKNDTMLPYILLWLPNIITVAVALRLHKRATHKG